MTETEFSFFTCDDRCLTWFDFDFLLLEASLEDVDEAIIDTEDAVDDTEDSDAVESPLPSSIRSTWSGTTWYNR